MSCVAVKVVPLRRQMREKTKEKTFRWFGRWPALVSLGRCLETEP